MEMYESHVLCRPARTVVSPSRSSRSNPLCLAVDYFRKPPPAGLSYVLLFSSWAYTSDDLFAQTSYSVSLSKLAWLFSLVLLLESDLVFPCIFIILRDIRQDDEKIARNEVIESAGPLVFLLCYMLRRHEWRCIRVEGEALNRWWRLHLQHARLR